MKVSNAASELNNVMLLIAIFCTGLSRADTLGTLYRVGGAANLPTSQQLLYWDQPTWSLPTWSLPTWGQPARGQPTRGQPTWGQPTWGQPTWGQPT